VVRPLRVGVQLPEIERRVPWTEYAAMARAAEEVGLDSIWLGDHLLYRWRDGRERGPWDTFTLLAALAAVTERVQIGPLVACTAWHPPGILARKAATLHEISGERFVLGLGAGWNEAEFRAFGLPFDHRASRFEEAFEIIRRLLEGERVTFTGRFHQVDDAVLLPRIERRPKLMIGTLGERVLAAALPYVDAWNMWSDWYGNTPEGFAAQNARVTDAARRAGRDPDDLERSACVFVRLDPTAGERQPDEGTVPLEPPADRIAAGLRALADAGLHEAILVLDPITERSIRDLGEVLVALG
jgi:alkanesulfonate monooxygenase SsuD/methylene tetrahydromethanopterin reductase-like flavin-dependent oxidoreductase (luciferase family)